jgi:hypothetical protein
MDELDKEVKRLIDVESARNFRRRLDPNGPFHCTHCKQTIDPEFIFCMWCGQHNANFDREKFREAYGTNSLEEARLQKCGEYHADAISYFGEEYKMFPDDETGPYVHPRYCTLCGTDLMPRDFVATA